MKVSRNTKFSFSEEEVATVRNLWEFLRNMDDMDYDDLNDALGGTDGPFFDVLDDLLHFMEDNIDLQDGN